MKYLYLYIKRCFKRSVFVLKFKSDENYIDYSKNCLIVCKTVDFELFVEECKKIT